MSAIVTDQFRIANANNFVDSVLSTDNNYYIFLGLSNPGTTSTPVGFGRTAAWGTIHQIHQVLLIINST